MIQEKNLLKSWFRTGNYPTQAQFWDLIDSYFHKVEDNMEIASIAGLQAFLNAKADREQVTSHTNDSNNPHQVTKQQIGLGNIPNAISSSTYLNDETTLATSAAVYELRNMLDTVSYEELYFESDNNYTLSSGLLEKLILIPLEDTTISIGSGPGETDLVQDLPLTANVPNIVQLDAFAYDQEKDFFFTGITSGTYIRIYKR